MSTLYIGLISGTSMDAVDAVLMDFAQPQQPALLATFNLSPQADLRTNLLTLSQDVASVSLAKLGELDQRVAHWFADAALALLRHAEVDAARIAAIGSHGQTLHHAPNAQHPFTLQIGNPDLIAARTGIPTVANLRGADMAAGGQGAPLVPAFHREIFRADEENRCVVNIGGIANITQLPSDPHKPVIGYDTGPGNGLMDAWIAEHLGEPHDAGGQWAASGQLNSQLLAQMLQEPYFQRRAPKSTGREYFNMDWIRRHLAEVDQAINPVDVQRTLLELTARSIASEIQDSGGAPARVLLCGGGAHNKQLRQRLGHLLAPAPVEDTDAYGIGGDWVEAATCAWLAMRRMSGLPGNLPSVTGATRAVVLGGVYDPGRVKSKD